MRLIPFLALALILVACGDDDSSTDAGRDASVRDGGSPPDGGMRDGGPPPGDGGGMDAEVPDGGPADGGPADGGVDPVERGRYLANHVWTCNDCHTPRDMTTGAFIAGMRFAGVNDLVPGMDLHTPNLTPDMDTGLGGWTDDEIRAALTTGVNREGNNLHPIMPYWLLHLLTPEDVDAIIAYLRSIPAVSNAITDMTPFPVLVPVVPADGMPLPTLDTSDPLYATAMAGRYLATPCLDCHTPPNMAPGEPPVLLAEAFGGGRVFPFPTPGGPVDIYTTNITQGMNGTALDSIMLIKGAITTSTEICPPMPIGPDGYWGLTDADAEAIATYIFHLPPIDRAMATPMCPLMP